MTKLSMIEYIFPGDKSSGSPRYIKPEEVAADLAENFPGASTYWVKSDVHDLVLQATMEGGIVVRVYPKLEINELLFYQNMTSSFPEIRNHILCLALDGKTVDVIKQDIVSRLGV